MLKIGRRPTDTPSDLIDLLLACHERIRRFIALAVVAGTRDDAPVDQIVDACQRVERYFDEALPLHVADEEESILPRLRGRSSELDRALDAMHEQHSAHEPQLAALLRASASLREQPEDPDRRSALASVARELEPVLEEHLQLEETLIFPVIAQLPKPTRDQIVGELRRRRAAH